MLQTHDPRAGPTRRVRGRTPKKSGKYGPRPRHPIWRRWLPRRAERARRDGGERGTSGRRSADPPVSAPRAVPWEGMGIAKDGKCTDCGRDCHEVPPEDLGGWIVGVGGALICTACSATHPGTQSAEGVSPGTAAAP